LDEIGLDQLGVHGLYLNMNRTTCFKLFSNSVDSVLVEAEELRQAVDDAIQEDRRYEVPPPHREDPARLHVPLRQGEGPSRQDQVESCTA
jgi:hypothetical protein